MAFTNTKVPGHQAEFDTKFSSKGSGTLDYKVCAIGQATDDGSCIINTKYLISSVARAFELFGEGSMLHLMAKKYFQNNVANELHMIALSKDDTDTTPTNASEGTLTFSGSASSDGNIYLYINGTRIVVPVTSGDASTAVASAVNTAIGITEDLPVYSDVSSSVVTLTAKNIGVNGDYIDVRINANNSEELPSGVSLSIVDMASGAGDPSCATALASLGSEWFQLFIFPYHDSTNYPLMKTFLDDRMGATQKIDGVAFSTNKDTYANLITFGGTRNSEQFSSVGFIDSMSAPFEWDSAIAGQVAGQLSSGNGNEAKPFQSLVLKNIYAPVEANRFSFAEENGLLNNGVSVTRVNANGEVAILRLITTYQTNSQGASDLSWLDVNTRFTAMFIRWDWVRRISLKYPQAKLSNDGTAIGPNQLVMTPSVGKSEAVSAFLDWEVLGLVEDFDSFKDSLTATRDLIDQNKFLWHLFPDFVNQLRNIETTISFVI